MRLIVIFGPAAAGKLTVATEVLDPAGAAHRIAFDLSPEKELLASFGSMVRPSSSTGRYTDRMRHAFVYHGESGFWIAEVPSLPGCVSQGATREQAVANVREAIGVHIETLVAHGQPVPHDALDALLVAV